MVDSVSSRPRKPVRLNGILPTANGCVRWAPGSLSIRSFRIKTLSLRFCHTCKRNHPPCKGLLSSEALVLRLSVTRVMRRASASSCCTPLFVIIFLCADVRNDPGLNVAEWHTQNPEQRPQHNDYSCQSIVKKA